MKNGLIDDRRMFKEAQKILDKLGIDINAHAIVRTLSVAQQQMVECQGNIKRLPDIGVG